MKQYIISTSIAFVVAGTAFAQDADQTSPAAPREPAMMGRMQVGAPTGGVVNTMYGKASAPVASARVIPASSVMSMMPTITTGDVTIDAKIKALQEERIAKLKALNAEYDAKLKALIGDRKITIGRGNGEPGDASSAGQMRARPMLDVRGSSSAPVQNGEPVGGYGSRDGDSDGDAMGENRPAAGIRGFIGRFFGRNN